MRELATVEAAEAAIKKIRNDGVEPTASRVLEVTGGSKFTVLRHMKGLRPGHSRISAASSLSACCRLRAI